MAQPPNWIPVIGLEVHVQLNTQSKLFSTSNAQYSETPNKFASEVDLGFPGTLPTVNAEAIHKAITFGLAVEGTIESSVRFDRKNYFYPDLPKGFQICQHYFPLITGGVIKLPQLDGKTKCVKLERAHLEEDAGKSVHDRYPDQTGLDFNRAGVPLLEIVTQPCLNSAADAARCFRQIHTLVTWLDLCDGNLNEASMRCDANVSVVNHGDLVGNVHTEIKNLNSFHYLSKAIECEVQRQITLLKSGKEIKRETLLYDPRKNETRPIRMKEQFHEYRYFPDPDLPPVHISAGQIEQLKKKIPELPAARGTRFVQQYGVPHEVALQLTRSRVIADYFEQTLAFYNRPNTLAGWITNHIFSKLESSQYRCHRELPIDPNQLAELLLKIDNDTLSKSAAKDVLSELWRKGGQVDEVIKSLDVMQVSRLDSLEHWINASVDELPRLWQRYLNGDEKLLDYFIGQVMKISNKQANPQTTRNLIIDFAERERFNQREDEIA